MRRLAGCAVLGLLAACGGGRTEPALVADGSGPAVGAALIREVGCGSCHTIPGIRGADGVVGPPLDAFARRSFIAGRIANTPENLIRWLLDPPAVDPETAMPNLGLTPEQARAMTSYLYTLDSR